VSRTVRRCLLSDIRNGVGAGSIDQTTQRLHGKQLRPVCEVFDLSLMSPRSQHVQHCALVIDFDIETSCAAKQSAPPALRVATLAAPQDSGVG
jgi:hypothetical protein